MMIPVIVESVRINLANGQRVVILKDAKIDRYLLIWVGLQESNAIALELQEQKAKRPLTVDLLKNTIEQLGASVTDINITELTDDVFFARIGVKRADGERIEIDARPSDAIGLAVRTQTPIYVDEQVLDEAAKVLPTESDDKLDVYREFVNQLFEGGERQPDA
jgi:bifunctional DNase/RNase